MTQELMDAADRRSRIDRRRRTVYALLYGSLRPRRRRPRRDGDVRLAGLDWHHPQWLAVAVLILLLSCADAGLTLTLLQQGAYEANPFMSKLVGGSALAFTAVKVSLTGGGVVVLTLLVRSRAFGVIRVSWMLYLVLAGYAGLIFYEVNLLEVIPFTS
ncbi:MAG TPA: DUF5658 family protein [Steroidobacteraceae bacterium]|nr:DUF5658 family protein [Steroidobacteraceae bacterium]